MIKDLQSGNLERNRDLFNSVLQGIPSPAMDIVLLNAAATLVVAEEAENLSVGVARAREAIVSGAAVEKMGAFAKLSQKLS